MNKAKHVLVENEFKKPQTFDSSFFIDRGYFVNDGSQNFLMFQLIHKTVTTFSVTTNTIGEWESKRSSYEKLILFYSKP